MRKTSVAFLTVILTASSLGAQRPISFNNGVAMDLTPTTYAGVGTCDGFGDALRVRFYGTNGTSITLQSKSTIGMANITPVFVDTSCVVTAALPQECTVVMGELVEYQLVLAGGSPAVQAAGECLPGVVVEHRYFAADVEFAGDVDVAGNLDVGGTSTFLGVVVVAATIQASASTRFVLLNETATATNPVLVANRSDLTTGRGGVLGEISDTIGGFEAVNIDPSRTFTTRAILAGDNQAVTLGVAATTYAVTTNLTTLTGDGGANTVATITGGVAGQALRLLFVDALVTITDTDAHTADTLDLSAAFTSADDTVLTLLHDGTSWYETSRSVN